jgi:hypothetical protein
MCETTLVVTADGHVHGVHSWTVGFRPLKCRRKAVTEDVVLAIAVQLERRGLHDEAEFLLDRFCAGFRLELAY